MGRNVTGMSAAAMDLLTEYPWPGNVRELKNCIEGMLVMSAADGLLDLPDIPNHVRRPSHRSSGPQASSGMTMKEIAHVLGVSRRTVDDDWSMAKAWLNQRLRDE